MKQLSLISFITLSLLSCKKDEPVVDNCCVAHGPEIVLPELTPIEALTRTWWRLDLIRDENNQDTIEYHPYWDSTFFKYYHFTLTDVDCGEGEMWLHYQEFNHVATYDNCWFLHSNDTTMEFTYKNPGYFTTQEIIQQVGYYSLHTKDAGIDGAPLYNYYYRSSPPPY